MLLYATTVPDRLSIPGTRPLITIGLSAIGTLANRRVRIVTELNKKILYPSTPIEVFSKVIVMLSVLGVNIIWSSVGLASRCLSVVTGVDTEALSR